MTPVAMSVSFHPKAAVLTIEGSLSTYSGRTCEQVTLRINTHIRIEPVDQVIHMVPVLTQKTAGGEADMKFVETAVYTVMKATLRVARPRVEGIDRGR
jgi:hypothetical protein